MYKQHRYIYQVAWVVQYTHSLLSDTVPSCPVTTPPNITQATQAALL